MSAWTVLFSGQHVQESRIPSWKRNKKGNKKGKWEMEKVEFEINLRRGLTRLRNYVASYVLTSVGIRPCLKNHRPMEVGRAP